MKPDIKDTDIIIRRAANGWIVFAGSEHEADHFMTTVYEDNETIWSEHESLICVIRDQFSYYVQHKKQGGIKLEVREIGSTVEEASKRFVENHKDTLQRLADYEDDKS